MIFDCATDGVITNDLWPDKKQEIMAARLPGKKLIFVAPYFGDEDPAVAMAEELGIEVHRRTIERLLSSAGKKNG